MPLDVALKRSMAAEGPHLIQLLHVSGLSPGGYLFFGAKITENYVKRKFFKKTAGERQAIERLRTCTRPGTLLASLQRLHPQFL